MCFERIKTPVIAQVTYLIADNGANAALVDPCRVVGRYLIVLRDYVDREQAAGAGFCLRVFPELAWVGLHIRADGASSYCNLLKAKVEGDSMRIHILIAAMLTLGSGADSAAGQNSREASGVNYRNMEQDKNSRVRKDELEVYYVSTGMFDMWDVDNDGRDSEVRFGTFLWEYYDKNNGGFVSDAEWKDGVLIDDCEWEVFGSISEED